MARTSQKDRYMDQLRTMYVDQQRSLSEISAELGPSVQTLSRWLREEEIPLQPRYRNPNAGRTAEEQERINARIRETKATKDGAKAGGRKRLPRIHVPCAVCGESFETRADQPKKTCSQKCGLWLANEQKMARAREEWAANPASTCQCGKTIPYENRNEWKYCSPDCRETYGKKRQADPENYVTFNCLRCDKEVTRYKNYGNGHSKYCSNECAQKHTKVKKHYGMEGLEIVFDSGYEAFFWGLCQLLKVPVERYDREKAVEWRPGLWYAPDFYLPSIKLAVELKGLEDDQDSERWEVFCRKVGELAVLSGEDLRKLAVSRSEFFELLP